MATSKLQKLADIGKKNTRVLGSLERYLLSRPRDASRRTDVLHPSEMVDPAWCHRASYFHLKGEAIVDTRSTGLTLATVFEEGHAIHHKWQTWFGEMGNLYGKWECINCGKQEWGLAYPECPSCEAPCTVYKEVSLYYDPLQIAGHADGWLIGLGEPLMLEIKSIGMGTLRFEAPELLAENDNDFEKAWKNLNAPFMKHIMQVQIYMKLAELIGYDNVPQEAVLIYEAKPNQQAKEFVVPKSDFGIAHLFEAAAMINECVKNNTPPACNISADGCGKCKGYND